MEQKKIGIIKHELSSGCILTILRFDLDLTEEFIEQYLNYYKETVLKGEPCSRFINIDKKIGGHLTIIISGINELKFKETKVVQ